MAVASSADVLLVARAARTMALAMGFDERCSDEWSLVATELATNLLKHARSGAVSIRQHANGDRRAMEIETVDAGPGISDARRALIDGFSTAGGLGLGLGTVRRLVDELVINSPLEGGRGTRVTCRRAIPLLARPTSSVLDIAALTRSHPGIQDNGDAVVVQRTNAGTLVGVIDGLGHGSHAREAAQLARQYLVRHAQQPLEVQFAGVEQVCRSTRGVVMALAQFNAGSSRMRFASVGNIEARLRSEAGSTRLDLRRGILGLGALRPIVSDHTWDASSLLIMHSDGVSSRWQWESIVGIQDRPATVIAEYLLNTLARSDDDASIIVVKDGFTLG